VLEGGFLFFLLGFVSLLIQTVLIREALFAFHGGEIGLGLFFALWLGSIALGARVGAGIVARDGAGVADQCSWLFSLGLALLCWAGILQVGIFRHHRAILHVEAGGYLPVLLYLLLLLLAAAPSAWLTGLLFPLGLRARQTSAGRAYAIESMGSMAGGALASLYALSKMSALSLLAVAGPLVLIVLMARRAFARRGSNTGAPSAWRAEQLPVLLLMLLTMYLFSGAASWTDAKWLRTRWANLETGTQPLLFLDTPYHHITVGELHGEASLYIDGLYQGGLRDPYVDSLKAAIVATQHPDPREMLILAPGCYGAVEVLAGAEQARVTLVRGDAGIDRAAEAAGLRVERRGAVGDIIGLSAPAGGSRLASESYDRLIRRTDDPRAAVVAMKDPVDLIVVLHGGPSGGAANRLYTQEFFAACAHRLKPGGALVMDLPGAANVASPESEILRLSIFGALRSVFVDVRIAPGTTHYLFAALPMGEGASDRMRPGAEDTPDRGLSRAEGVRDAAPDRDPDALATPLTWDPDSLAARRMRLWPGARPWPPALFATLFPDERVSGLHQALLHAADGGVIANRDRRPIVYYEQLRRWDRLSGSGLSPLLRAWHDHPWWWSSLALAALAAAGLFLRRRRGQAVVSLAGTGMAGMGADLLLLFLYQTYRGTLYLKVGLVVALFMLGLGLGALAGVWLLKRVAPGRAVALSDLVWVVFLLAWMPLMTLLPGLGGSAAEALLLSLALAAGVLTAIPFPWVVALLQGRAASATSGRSPAVAGGIADAADHAGAVFGALLTGTFLIPLLGFDGALLFLAGIKLLSALGWLLPSAISLKA
jgi:predicted membrane-bound spermidine synthase